MVNHEGIWGKLRRLDAYNHTRIKCLGTIDIQLRFIDNICHKESFYVVDVPGSAVLGLPSARKLKAITIHSMMRCQEELPLDPVQDLQKMYPDQFYTIENFQEPAKLHLKEDAKPHIDAPRKCGVHMKP